MFADTGAGHACSALVNHEHWLGAAAVERVHGLRLGTLGLHLLVLVLQGGLRELFLFLLGPAEVGAPQGEAVSDEHVEHADVEGEPPVVGHCDAHAAFALEEYVLHPGHHARGRKVENAEPAANLSQQTPAVDVVEQEKEEDGELHAECDDDSVAQLIIRVALAGPDSHDDYTDAARN